MAFSRKQNSGFCDWYPSFFGHRRLTFTPAFATGIHRSTGAPGLARPCPDLPGLASQADPIPSLLLTRRYSGRQSLGKAQTPSNYYTTNDQKWATLTRLFTTTIFDPPVRPDLPGFARPCPALRVKPTRFQAYSSRAGTLEGSRLAKHILHYK